MKKRHLLLLITATCITVISCRKDQTTTPTCDGSKPDYDSNIKQIIDSRCMGSNCHGSGSSIGDFTSYNGLQPYLNNGTFTKEVLTNKTMPRNSTLSQDQLNMIKCWQEQGFPEN